MLGQLFTDHPKALGMSWAEHGAGAVVIGARMIGGGLAWVPHGLLDPWAALDWRRHWSNP